MNVLKTREGFRGERWHDNPAFTAWIVTKLAAFAPLSGTLRADLRSVYLAHPKGSRSVDSFAPAHLSLRADLRSVYLAHPKGSNLPASSQPLLPGGFVTKLSQYAPSHRSRIRGFVGPSANGHACSGGLSRCHNQKK
jgi:hypothetical protein